MMRFPKPNFSTPSAARTLRAAVLATAMAVGACGGDPDETAVQCPKPYLLPDASSFTRYNGRGTDIADLVLRAKLIDVKGSCAGKIGVKQERARAHVVMLVTRGPAAQSNAADISYSVGVIRNGQVLDEHSYVQHLVFPPNVDSVEATGQDIGFVLPTDKLNGGASYHLYFWLNLSPAELAANRQTPR